MIIQDKKQLFKIATDKPLLIMFPFAGGNSYSYRDYMDYLGKTYDILCPELPGRGSLSNESLITNMNKLVEHLFETWIKPLDLNKNYVLFGHSMGALTAYLLSRRIRREKRPLPLHLVVSGRRGPSVIKEKLTYNLPPSAFRNELLKMGGVPNEVLNDMELMDYFEPILRSDFEAVETHSHIPDTPLNIPITAFYGTDEDIASESMFSWKKESEKQVEIIEMTGNHFFIFEHKKIITSYLCQLVDKYYKSR